jgi:radical SAM superfamily enzyme YgiQ (UPF0313 family)
MHITLICADHDSWASGLRSISAVLRRAGHETRIILAGSGNGEVQPSESDAIAGAARNSAIIGVSSMSRASRRAKAILAGLRPLGKVTVWGGVHPSIFPEDCVAHADLVCRGEGEEFMLDLAERLSAGVSHADIPNAARHSNGGMVLNGLRPLMGDLDQLPFPDLAFDNEYSLMGGSLVPRRERDGIRYVLFSGSRGCLYSCNYCSNGQLKAMYAGLGRYARKMSVGRFIEGLEHCRRSFAGVKSFYFTDEDFFARPVDEIRQFAEEYPRRVGLPFECMASPLQITDEKMSLLANAGLWRIDVGLESGSEQTRRKQLNRPVTDSAAMRAAIAVARHPHVVAYYFLIIGNPYESQADLLKGIDFLRNMPAPFFLRTYNLVFLPGTRLYERACEDGVISGVSDSAFEMDFLGGFDHRGHAWKRDNLYLNSLLALMAGKFTRRRMGLLPRAVVPALTAPGVVDFCDRHPSVGEALSGLSRTGLTVRRRGLELVSKVARNPQLAYGVKAFLVRRRRATPDGTSRAAS